MSPRYRRSGSMLPSAILACLLLVLPSGAFATEMTELRPIVRVGEKAAGFTLKQLDGKEISFHPGDGRPALLVFWVVACPLCRELTPLLSDISRRHGKEIRVVGVNLDGPRFSNAIRQFVKENRITFPVGLDELRGDFFLASDPYGVEKTPTAVLVDRNGVVRGAYVAEEMRGMIRDFDWIAAGLKKGTTVKK